MDEFQFARLSTHGKNSMYCVDVSYKYQPPPGANGDEIYIAETSEMEVIAIELDSIEHPDESALLASLEEAADKLEERGLIEEAEEARGAVKGFYSTLDESIDRDVLIEHYYQKQRESSREDRLELPRAGGMEIEEGIDRGV